MITQVPYLYQAVEIDISCATSFTFEVQACNVSRILLMKTPGDEENNILEIVIGKSNYLNLPIKDTAILEVIVINSF